MYKTSLLRVRFTDGTPVAGIIITCTAAGYTKNMTVGTLTIKANDDHTIHWTGSKPVFEAVASEMVRVTKLEVFK